MALVTDRKIVREDNLVASTYVYELTIASGATQSDHFRLTGDNIIGILFPAAMTGTSLTVEVSFDGSSFHALTGVSLGVTVDEALEVASSTIFGWPFVRFVSSAAEGAERTLTVLVKEI